MKYLIALAVCVQIAACAKQQTEICKPCTYAGRYEGTYHNLAGCYSCVPTTDTTFGGIFFVDTLAGDSLQFINESSGQEWRFAYNDSGAYKLSGCCTYIVELEFKAPDSLIFYYNNGGSGGYFRQQFWGIKK